MQKPDCSLRSRACLLCRCLFFAHQYGNARGRRNIQKDLRQIRIARLYLDEQKDTEKCHQRHKGENRTKINGIFLAAQAGTGAQKRETHSKEKYNAIQMYRVLIYMHTNQTVPCHTGAIDKAERESQTGRDPKILDFCQHQRQQCVRRTENAGFYICMARRVRARRAKCPNQNRCSRQSHRKRQSRIQKTACAGRCQNMSCGNLLVTWFLERQKSAGRYS